MAAIQTLDPLVLVAHFRDHVDAPSAACRLCASEKPREHMTTRMARIEERIAREDQARADADERPS